MSIFTDYASKMRQAKTPFNGGLQQYVQEQADPRVQSPLYNPEKFYSITPQAQAYPVVDSSNAIGSLAEMLGPTPAEREAAERRMMEGKAKMQAWTGLFDGLRQLGNLYYTTKGATPQSYVNPYQYVDQQYQQQRQLYNDMANYRKQYANSLYNLQRQMETDKMAKEKHNAVLDWYKNRDEQNTRKVDIAEFKAMTDADYKKATLEQKNAINEVRMRLMEGQISKTEAERQYKLIMAGNAAAGTRKVVTKPDGSVTVTETTPAGRSGKGSRRGGSLLPGSQGRGSLLPK